MQANYSADGDILSLQVPNVPVDYSEETDAPITRFNGQGKLVQVEMQSEKGFLLNSFTCLIKEEEISLS